MKLRLGIVLFALVMSACNNHEKEQLDKIKALHAQDSTMAAEAKSKDSLITNYVNTMGAIQDNLDSLKVKEHILSMNSPEGNKNARTTILGDITAIDNAIIADNKQISKLEARLRKMQNNDASLKKMIDNLTKEVAEKDAQITMLQSRLNGVSDSMVTLTHNFNDTIAEIRKDRSTINAMTNQMNTVYYVVGTMKQLKDKGVISKTGGVLGIGRTSELSAKANMAAFTKGDKTQIGDIPLNGKLLKLVTSHPAGSYKINKNDKKTETLSISDATSFWSESKYLVVEIK